MAVVGASADLNGQGLEAGFQRNLRSVLSLMGTTLEDEHVAKLEEASN